MSRKFDTALDDCLNLLRTGTSVTDCLARYPEHAEELLPLLSLASGVRAVRTPRPDPVAVQANRQRMLEAAEVAAVHRQQRRLAPLAWIWGRPGGSRIRSLYRATMTLAAMAVLVSLAVGALFASAANSLPGQALYPVKRFGEDARLSLTFNSAAQQELRDEYSLERRREIRQVLDTGQRAVFEFRGNLEAIDDNYWIVGGLKVTLYSDTVIEGYAATGAMVIVRASSSGDGSLRALKLQVLTNPLLLTPVVTSTPTPTVTPTATERPSRTPMPSATATPAPSATPTPSATPSPTPTLTSTPSPLPTETSTAAPTATSAPSHTEEPEPTETPDDDETEEPEATDDPDPAETEEP